MTDLPFEDRTDFEDADRGLIGSLDPGVVKDANGRVVWDNDAYAYLEGDCPDTANPSLWRQSQLCARQGLFEVTDGHLPGPRAGPVEHDASSKATAA